MAILQRWALQYFNVFWIIQNQNKNNRNTPTGGNTKDVKIAVPLKYLRNFCRTLKLPLIICETNLMWTWSWTCVITNSTGAENFAMIDTKLYVSVVTL